jgi:hypothetical protein
MGPARAGRTANRRFLYWAVFFIALGAIMLAVERRLIDASPVVDALRLWPVIVVALILAVLVRRTEYSLPMWLTVAAVSGLAIGGGIAAGPRVALDCTDPARPVLTEARGTFDGPATVHLTSGCGSLVVSTAPGPSWRLVSEDPGRATGRVSSSASDLLVDAGTTEEWHVGASSPRTWHLTVPTSTIDDLRLSVNAGDGDVDLAGAQVRSLAIAGSATQLTVDLSRAVVSTLSVTLRLGGLSLSLPDADLAADFDVTVGQIDVCVPPDVGLHVRRESQLGEITYEGFEQHAAEWQSPGYTQAPFHVDLNVRPSLGGIAFNPIRGCST